VNKSRRSGGTADKFPVDSFAKANKFALSAVTNHLELL
jgi:hypothetical protein